MNKKIVVFGTGYVGLSNAVLLSQYNFVLAIDIDSNKVKKINERTSPIRDTEIEKYLKEKTLNLRASSNYKSELDDIDFVVICTPTDYNVQKKKFDTSSVEKVITEVRRVNKEVPIVIKSTIPVGFIEQLKDSGVENVFFVPEFLREGKALYDNLHPSRIIVGEHSEAAIEFAQLLVEGAEEKDVPVLFTNSTEAEAIKLFSNTYLAMRVAFFNELDTYAVSKNLKTKEILDGVCSDPRIGNFYNNPSFGYGGYCLPKDTRQLLANYEDIPQTLIRAIVEANNIRKSFISKLVIEKRPSIVGVFRLNMKKNSDNFRASAILDICEQLKEAEIKVIVYEPTLSCKYFQDMEIFTDFKMFCEKADIILANRMEKSLEPVKEKVLTRDIYQNN